MNQLKIRGIGSRNDFAPLHQAMNRLIQDAAWAPFNAGAAADLPWRPAADAQETDEAVLLTLALPGVEAEAVEVSFEKGSLIVSGQLPQRDAERRWVLSELPAGRFERRFSLKTPIDAERIEAKVSGGLLTLTLPKSEQVKPRKIAVTAG